MGVIGQPSRAVPEDLDELLLGKRASLNPLFNPKNVAVVDAPEQPGTVGYKVLSALLNSPIGNNIFPVDRNRTHVMAVRAFPTISAIPAAVDLAIIASPKERLPEVIGECAEAQVKTAIGRVAHPFFLPECGCPTLRGFRRVGNGGRGDWIAVAAEGIGRGDRI